MDNYLLLSVKNTFIYFKYRLQICIQINQYQFFVYYYGERGKDIVIEIDSVLFAITHRQVDLVFLWHVGVANRRQRSNVVAYQ